LFSCNNSTSEKSQTLLNSDDLKDKNINELRIMRNEIFARHGYIFNSDDLTKYFSKMDWYEPKYSNVDSLLTETDKENIQTIINQENIAKNIKEQDNKQYIFEIKGCKQIENYYLSVVSVYKLPLNGILEHDTSYYWHGHFLVSSERNLCAKNKSDFDIDTYKSDWKSFIEIHNPCDEIHIGQLQLLGLNYFDKDSKTLRFLKPECNDYTDNIFIEFKQGQLIEKFTADTWTEKEVNFKQLNDSIFYTLTDNRDEIVSQFQTDYRYEYNNRTNKLTFVTPNKQRINWQSEALVELIAYKTIKAAQNKDTSNIAYKVKIGDSFYLDTLYRDLKVLLIFRNNVEKGYLNTINLDYKKITYNGAG
jgi:hypothetical protein